MKIPSNTPDTIDFQCNICGGENRLETIKFHRELAVCGYCGSNARFRGIIYALAKVVGIDDIVPLKSWPQMKHIIGAGMSDWLGYADTLTEKFCYENTYYDRMPQLDILNPDSAQIAKYDFVISTDVFEHILPPLQQGFNNLLSILKPGGSIIFSVPYTRSKQTLEHFPGLYNFEIIELGGKKVLVNRDVAGQLQAYDNLVFHGGEGATLEMRLFCENDVLGRLVNAGFENIRVHDEPYMKIGFFWPPLEHLDPEIPLYAYIISAQRPYCTPSTP
jgi:SAM-dependent methyltransferase